MNVLVTGAAGRLGHRLAQALEPNHDVLLSDIVPLDVPRFTRLDVTDPDAARAAVQGCDAVVHMAILDWPICPPEEALCHAPGAIRVHAIGTHNMLQAAWETDVRRFVHISSVSVVDGISSDTKANGDTRHFSNDIYGMTKGFGEDICRMFRDVFGFPVAVLRPGSIYMPEAEGAWIGNVHYSDLTECPTPGTAVSRVHVDDVTRAIELALEASDPGGAPMHVVGADSGDRWDLGTARRAIGWEPRYSFSPDGLPHWGGISGSDTV